MLGGCSQDNTNTIYELDAFTEGGFLRAVIEIPAGTNAKIEYNPSAKAFEQDQLNGKGRVIEYLPYPGNYGFIPGTYSDPTTGGDGDALDILILSSSLPTSTVLEVIPIAVFKLLDNAEKDYKIIAIPRRVDLQVIKANNLASVQSSYPQVLEIITAWFLHYNPKDTSQNLGWGNEKEAILEIQKVLRKSS
jgi:inorganic pyrophosphatase